MIKTLVNNGTDELVGNVLGNGKGKVELDELKFEVGGDGGSGGPGTGEGLGDVRVVGLGALVGANPEGEGWR